MLRKPKKKCERCQEVRLMAEIKKENVKAGKCRGEHLPCMIIDAQKANPTQFKELYTDGDGVLEKIMEGPTVVHCDECGNDFAYYKVLWNCSASMDCGWGPASPGLEKIVWYCTHFINSCPLHEIQDAESLEKFFHEKNKEAHAELEAVDQILEEPFLLGSALASAADGGGGGGGDDDDDDDNLIVVGEDANGPPKKKTKRGGKKYRQLRDKAKELRASTVESASVVSTSSINTSKFKKISIQYAQRVAQLREHRKTKLCGIDVELVNFFTYKHMEFYRARQQRVELPEGLRTVEQIEKFSEGLKFQGIHNGAICAVDFQNKYILSGGVDKYVALNIFDVADTQRKTFVGHLAKISKVLLHPSIETFVSGAFDSQIRIWNVNQCNAIHTISIHGQAVNDLSFHPTGDYVLCSSEDSHWSLIDLNAGRPLVKVKANDDLPGICCGQFHPDGLIFGTCGKNGVVKFWDIKTQKIMTQYEGHQGAVGAISFSENGYYLATGSTDGKIKIWDLRKHAVLVNLSPFEENNAVNCLTFDYSGNYLAVGGPNTQIYRTDEWKQICQLNTHTQEISGLKFAHNASMVISSSLDGNICACF